MPSITRSHSFVAGEVPTAAEFNVDIDAIITLLNGLLDGDNVDKTVIANLDTANSWTARQSFSATFSNGIAIGSLIIWYDSTNSVLRYKHSAPSSEIDGEVWV